jgi:hypothetical protein
MTLQDHPLTRIARGQNMIKKEAKVSKSDLKIGK